jgi:sugar lactone lactonase YvrE
MSYPSQKRLRRGRGIAAVVAALMAAGAGLATSPAAQAVPTPPGPAGHIQTMGGITRDSRQGGYGPENVIATESQFQNPRGMGFAPNGDIYITDALNQRVRKIDNNGIVSHVAGSGLDCSLMADQSPCHTGDGGAAVNATLNEPHGVAVDSLGNVYIADSKNCVIRKVDTGGTITRYAGTGQKVNGKACVQAGLTEGPALTTNLDQPKSVFMHRQAGGNDTLWIAAFGDSQIRKIDVVKNGVAVAADQAQSIRVAGNNRNRHYSDGSANGFDAREADLRHAEGVWVANDGTVYFTDGGNNLVRKVAVAAQNSSIRKISTIAGDVAMAEANKMNDEDLLGNSDGDGGLAINAHIDKPRGITGDSRFVYVAEEHGSRIRRIDMSNGTINTIGGDGTILEQRNNGGTAFIKGENGPALETQFAMLHDIALSPDGKAIWIADSRNNRVRAIFDPANAPGANIPTGGNPAVNPGPGGGGDPVPVPGKSGYWMLGADGRVWGFGDAKSLGDVVGRMPAGAKAIHIEPTPSFGGYWINDDRGGVWAFGDAVGHGGILSSALQAGETVTSLSATPDGQGYWLFTSRGRVFTKGTAKHLGDLANVKLNGPVQSSIPTPSGLGYYMVGSDGGVFTFGDAAFHGSTGNVKLNKPVMSLVPSRSGKGYWLVASDGGIFTFGDAKFQGSLGDVKLNKPVVGMVRYGIGYLMVGADGGIFDFSGSPNGFKGSLGNTPPSTPITFAATLDS